MIKPLTVREFQVFKMVVRGKTSKQIAETLEVSARTVEAHRSRIMLKIEAKSISELVRYAVRTGVIEA